MTVHIFGKRFADPAFDDAIIVWTPVGQPCVMCGEQIAAGDSGVMMPVLRVDAERVGLEPEHIECHMRSLLGPVEHVRANCQCRNGVAGHIAVGETYREQARQVMAYLVEQRAERDETVWLAHL